MGAVERTVVIRTPMTGVSSTHLAGAATRRTPIAARTTITHQLTTPLHDAQR